MGAATGNGDGNGEWRVRAVLVARGHACGSCSLVDPCTACNYIQLPSINCQLTW